MPARASVQRSTAHGTLRRDVRTEFGMFATYEREDADPVVVEVGVYAEIPHAKCAITMDKRRYCWSNSPTA